MSRDEYAFQGQKPEKPVSWKEEMKRRKGKKFAQLSGSSGKLPRNTPPIVLLASVYPWLVSRGQRASLSPTQEQRG